MGPQAVANCLWAALQLKDEIPDVRELILVMTPIVAREACVMEPQALANSLEAIVLLGDADLDVEGCVSEAANRLSTLLPSLRGKDLTLAVPLVLWALAKATVQDDKLLALAAARFSRAQLSTIPGWHLCAMAWAYEVLDTSGRFSAFQAILAEEIQSRDLVYYDVQSSQLGRFDWSQA